MMKLKPEQAGQLLAVFLLIIAYFNAGAQKLPATQQISLRAPENISIDGKTTEWGSNFQAYNKVNHLFYSIANDDKNLYLVIQSSDRYAVSKMVRWGVALTINSADKRKIKDPDNIMVSFPVLDEKRNLGIIHSMGEKDKIVNAETMMASRNAKIPNVYKLILVSGIKGINEPTISVYNTTGIKAASLFDNKLAYNYELAIPLKYFNNLINNGARFSYNIRLNGMASDPHFNVALQPMRVGGGSDPNQDYQNYPTDFWGEYTLAKK